MIILDTIILMMKIKKKNRDPREYNTNIILVLGGKEFTRILNRVETDAVEGLKAIV